MRMLKPLFYVSGTGVQLAVSDTDTAPEGLFFELVKPPHHGIVLKHDAGVQEHMRAGEMSRNLQHRGGSVYSHPAPTYPFNWFSWVGGNRCL